jgi:hypothetical protein
MVMIGLAVVYSHCRRRGHQAGFGDELVILTRKRLRRLGSKLPLVNIVAGFPRALRSRNGALVRNWEGDGADNGETKTNAKRSFV